MFYERLNQLCKLHGTTVTEVATTHLGVASSAATNWKHGASPRCDVVTRAAEHFGVSTDYLLGLSDTPAAPASPAEAEVLQALNLLSSASGSARKAALAAMRAVILSIDDPQE